MSSLSVAYLEWARVFMGRARYDLASSGIRTPRFEESFGEIDFNDLSAIGKLPAAIAAYHDLPTETVTPALGTSHAIWLAYASLLSPGDEVLVERPVYEPLHRVPESLGARVSFFDRSAPPDYAVHIPTVLGACTPKTRVVTITNLHNPTGVRTPDSTLRDLADALSKRGCTLLISEVYAPFDRLTEGGRWKHSAKKLHPNIVTVSSLTKCFGLGVHRLGWMLSDPEIAKRARKLVTLNVGLLPAAQASMTLAALSHIDSLSARAQHDLREKRELVASWMKARRDVVWSAPREGLFGFAHLPGAHDVQQHIEDALVKDDLLVGPGVFFAAPEAVRVAWSLPKEDLNEGLVRLGRLFDRIPRG